MVDTVCTLAIQWNRVAGGIEFDWNAENIRHLERHGVARGERDNEERYKVLGATRAGRILVAVWTPRCGRVRAVTAYRAGRVGQKLYWETRG